jgi:predicted transcriptional regulator
MSMVSVSGLPLNTLIETVKANIKLGDRDAKRSDERYMAAGLHLIELERRLPEERPDAFWPTWIAENFPQVGYSRVEQLISIANGETTQAEINAATAASMRRAYTPAPRSDDEFMTAADDIVGRRGTGEPPPPFTSDDVNAPSPTATRLRQRRANQRAARVAAGANLPPPLAPIEHRRLLKQGRDLLAAMSFDDLKVAVETVKVAVAEGESEADIKVANALYLSGLISDAEIAWRAKWKTNGAGLLEVIKSALDAMSDETVREFSKALAEYMDGRPEALVVAAEPVESEAVPDGAPASDSTAEPEAEEAAVNDLAVKYAAAIKDSIHDYFIICLEDGRKFKTLKRHLRTHYNLTPEEYREKSGLPDDYPIVCSSLAKQMKQSRKPATEQPAPDATALAAEKFGVAEDDVRMAAALTEAGRDDLIREVEAERMTLGAAVLKVAADEIASEQTELERKMLLAESEVVGVVEGQPLAQHSAAARAAGTEQHAATVIRKGSKKHGPVIRPDPATYAAIAAKALAA